MSWWTSGAPRRTFPSERPLLAAAGVAVFWRGPSGGTLGHHGTSPPLALERSARKLGRLYPHGRAEVSMAGSYSTDLRERVLAAVEAGATPETAARRVAGGRSTAHR